MTIDTDDQNEGKKPEAKANEIVHLDNALASRKGDEIAPISERISSRLAETAGQETALKRLTDIVHVEHRNGLPVISVADYRRMYNTDIRALGDHGAATFNFQGYVRDAQGEHEYYKDSLATNGILKSKSHSGLHVGTDGIVSYEDLNGNWNMKGPADIGEYNVYIRVPTALQREQLVVVDSDRCQPAREHENPEAAYRSQEKFAEEFGKYSNDTEPKNDIVIRLGLRVKGDRQARKKAEIIHMKIVKHLEDGKPIYEIREMVEDLVDKLRDLSEQELKREYPLLQQ